MGKVCLQERINKGFGKLCGGRDASFDQEGIELATPAEDAATGAIGISSGFEVGGEAVKVGTERAAPEVNEGAFFSIPLFEHKMA